MKAVPTRILVADDNAADVYLLREGLNATDLSYELEHVLDGDGAIQRFGDASELPRPDLLILDLHLPKVSGTTVVQSLLSRGVSTPVIVLTSLSSERDRETLKALGVRMVLDKPRDLESCFVLGRRVGDFCRGLTLP
jgi:CheY-like chemotaxis protein